jgi:putative NADH-flavin reductase
MSGQRLVVLGGTGGVGRHLVLQAVERGHEVTLLARATSTVDVPQGVRVVRGALDDRAAVDEALSGATALLSAIGMQRKHPANPWSASLSPPDLTSSTARLIVDGMKRHGIGRLIAVSAGGVGDSAPRLNWAMRFFLATTMIGAAYRDLAAMEEVYAHSGLDWLAPRPTRLTNGGHAPAIRVVEAFGSLDAIARRDVARWMLDALELPVWPAPAWGGRTPQISAA